MVETQIKDALIRLHLAIKKSDGSGISSSLAELDELNAKHGAMLHPQLSHYLDGRSYAKALAYLGGAELLDGKPQTPPGGCHGGQK